MKRLWPSQAFAVQESVAGTLARLGGTDFTRRCELDMELRDRELGPAIDKLELNDLDPAGDATEAAAAAMAARAAGSVLCPWPLVARLTVPRSLRRRIDAVYLTDGEPKRLEHLDLVGRPVTLDVRTYAVHEIAPAAQPTHLPLDPFGVACRHGRRVEVSVDGMLEVSIILTAFWVLGALDRVVAQTSAYARERHQFGRPIASFGAIQWRLSDLAVARESLHEMATFTLMRMTEGRASPADAFALRLTTLESAREVLANGHQILGAIGLCEEHDVTLVDRHLQPSLLRPTGMAATVSLLTAAIAEHGFDAIQPIRPAAAMS